MNRFKLLQNMLLGASLIAWTPAAKAASVLLTFDDLSAMSNSAGTITPSDAQLSNGYSALGVVFSSLGGFVAVVNHEPSNPIGTPSYPNIIAGTAANGALDYASPITAVFWGVTNYVKVLGDRDPSNSASNTATLTAYGINGQLLGSVSSADCCGLGNGPVLSLSLAGIHSVVLSENTNTIGFDNFQYNAPTAVPGPNAGQGVVGVLALLAGFGLRRRQRE